MACLTNRTARIRILKGLSIRLRCRLLKLNSQPLSRRQANIGGKHDKYHKNVSGRFFSNGQNVAPSMDNNSHKDSHYVWSTQSILFSGLFFKAQR